MNKLTLLALPVLAVLAVAGLAAAQPNWDPQEMTDEQKDLRIQMLDQKQEMIQDRIAYINGELTEEQFQERFEQHREDMEPLRDQLREQCPMDPESRGYGGNGPKGRGAGGFHGRGMMGQGL